jgi:hypothetical protein
MATKIIIAVILGTLWCVLLTFQMMNKSLTFWTTIDIAETSTTLPSMIVDRSIVGMNQSVLSRRSFEAPGTAKFSPSPETPGSISDADDADVATQKYNTKNDSREARKKEMSSVPTDDDCFRARNDTVPLSLYRNLPRPYLNLAFPKMGTSSLHYFFKCGGLISGHFRCPKGLCANCIKRSVEAGQPPLSQCGEVDVYTQMDDGKYFPQIELLDALSLGYPNATFFLIFRSMKKWYHSITHWPPRKNPPHLSDRFKMFNITGAPTSNGRRVSRHNKQEMKEFSDWYCNHVKRVRKIAHNSSHTLVEIDLEDPATGRLMANMFDIDEKCWGHHNVNTNIHPELNQSEVRVSRVQLQATKSHPKRTYHYEDIIDRNDKEIEDGEMVDERQSLLRTLSSKNVHE